MSRADQIYPLHRLIERELGKISRDPHNKDILTRYYRVRVTEVQPATVVNELIRLNMISQMLGKKFEEAAIEDIENLVFKIDRRGNMPNTINKFRKILKNFYRWMHGLPMREYPPQVRWIRLKKVPLITVKPNDLLTFDECLKLTRYAKNIRDKALFQCTLDSGCRIGEILTVKLGEVQFNEHGAVLECDGKTGEYPCILTWSASTLATWINNHPFREDKEAPLWVKINRDRPIQMQYSGARAAFAECVKKAGHKKRVWLHLLRHVSSTEDAMNGMPDSFRKYKHHWAPNSKMGMVYEHLSRNIIPNIQKNSWSRINPEKREMTPEKKNKVELNSCCKRCEHSNQYDAIFCTKCGFSLKENKSFEANITKTKTETLLEKLLEDPEKIRKLLSIIE